MKNLLFYGLLSIFGIQLAQAQNPQWNWVSGFGSGGTDIFNAVKVDQQNNVICGGAFQNTIDFDPGAGIANLTATSNDAVIAKYDQDGNYLWAFKLGGWAMDQVSFLDVDAEGNIYASGMFRGTADFNPGAGTFNLISPNDQTNSFLLKVDGNGIFQWAKMYYAVNGVTNRGLAVDQGTGDVYFTGYYYATVDMDPNEGTSGAYNAGNEDFFISKLNSDGHFIRGVRFGDVSTQNISAMVIRPENGNLIIGGHFFGAFDTDPSPDSTRTITTTQAGTADSYVIQLDSTFQWVMTKQIAGQYNQILYGLNYYPGNGGHIGLTGNYSDVADLDPSDNTYALNLLDNNGSIFIAQWTVDGEFEWAKALGSTSGNDYGNEVAYDEWGNMIATGSVAGIIDIHPDSETILYGDAGSVVGAYVIELNTAGYYLWGKFINDYPSTEGPFIDPSTDGSLMVVGSFGPGALIYDGITLEHETFGDILVGKMGCETATFTEVHSCGPYMNTSGEIYSESGIYADTLINASGCDSLAGIQLYIHQPDYSSFTTQTCESYILPSGQDTVFTSGIYQDVLINQFGCDSMLTIEVEVIQTVQSYITASACGSYLSPDGDEWWTSSGIYQDTLISQFGCDSIVIVELWLQNTSAILEVAECQSYLSPDGLEWWTESGIYLDTLINQYGCDSVVTVYLDILADEVTIEETGCFEFTSPSGQYVWTETGLYTDTLTNSLGCDSIIHFDLTIVNVSNEVTQIENMLVCAQEDAEYQWLDCNNNQEPIADEVYFMYELSENGSYAVTITYNGCTAVSDCVEVANIQVDESAPPIDFILYPIPAGDQIQWTTKEHVLSVELYTMDGHCVLHEANRNNLLALPIDLSSGSYVMKFFGQEHTWFVQLLKH
ncbi:MAG: T9SS type A sorting domain-containing protein [Flavobacteriales bacterium]|nr:T9SS type A sorting domain-containing protein [Flavobacteriales bacterium]